jgi:hypothetical protein
MLATFVWARNAEGKYILNEFGEYMVCAVDGQHRVAMQYTKSVNFPSIFNESDHRIMCFGILSQLDMHNEADIKQMWEQGKF